VWEYTTRPAADYSRAGCDGNLSSDQVWGGALPEVEEVNESDEINQQVRMGLLLYPMSHGGLEGVRFSVPWTWQFRDLTNVTLSLLVEPR
jgi:hypothetical protein